MRFLRNSFIRIYSSRKSLDRANLLIDEIERFGLDYSLVMVDDPLSGSSYPHVFIDGRSIPFRVCLARVRILNDAISHYGSGVEEEY